MEREQFLRRVSAALRSDRLPAVVATTVPRVEIVDPIERFIAEATAVSATVTRVHTPEEASAAVEAVFAETGASRFLAWDGLEQVLPGWPEWSARYERIDAAIDPARRGLDLARVGTATGGVTGADAGIAASGSVVLGHGPGRPRSASLLVDTHVVVLRTDAVVATLGEAIDRIDWGVTSNLVFITGPSRTGDIESVLTLGVHGPRHVHIVLLD